MTELRKILKIVNKNEEEFASKGKPRFIIIFDKNSRLKLIFNPHQPFKYYSIDFENKFKFDKPNVKSDSSHVRYLAQEVLYFFIKKEEIFTDEFKKEIEAFCLKEKYDERVWESINTILSKDYNIRVKEKEKKLINATEELELLVANTVNATHLKDDELCFSLAYFKNSETDNSLIVTDDFSKVVISMNQYEDILKILKKSITRIVISNKKQEDIKKALESLSELKYKDILAFKEKIKEIESISKLEKLESFKRILKYLSMIKKGTPANSYMREFIDRHNEDFKKLLSAEKLHTLKTSSKQERILNLILEDNPWLLGYSDDNKVKKYQDVLDQEKTRWKPDLIIQRKDGGLDIYELKLNTDILYSWDDSHKSHYAKGVLSKAASQIESQHQYLLNEGNSNITKNDTLFLVMGNYENEISNINLNEKEIEHWVTKEKAIEQKKKDISLLRNKYKNVKLIFYDETDFNY